MATCEVCDLEGCTVTAARADRERHSRSSDYRGSLLSWLDESSRLDKILYTAEGECAAHRVNWRQRALAAEARADALEAALRNLRLVGTAEACREADRVLGERDGRPSTACPRCGAVYSVTVLSECPVADHGCGWTAAPRPVIE